MMAGCKSSGILSLGIVELHVPAALPTGKEPTVSIECNGGWTAYSIWMIRRGGKTVGRAGNRKFLFGPGVILYRLRYLLFNI
jgi:hypothetical protein